MLLSSAALFFSILATIRVSGRAAGALTSLFWVTFTYGIYFQSITKTYPLLLFFFSLSFYILLSNKNKEKGLILASLLVILATLTRLSALFFALPVLFYAISVGTKSTRLTVLTICVVAGIIFSLFSLPNFPSTLWNLLLHHTTQWGNISGIEKVRRVLLDRLPVLFLAYPTYISLMLTVLVFNFRAVYSHLFKNKVVLLIFICTLLFAIPHLVSGGYYSEYFVPWLFMMFSILSIFLIEIFPKQKTIARILLQTLVLSTFVLGFIRGGLNYIDTSGGRLPIEEAQELASLVSKNTDVHDLIFALQGLWISLESNRETLPGMAMAQFSYYEGGKDEAIQYNLVNDEMITESIQNKAPRVIILTESDWELLEGSTRFEEIKSLIFENYFPLVSQDNFGQNRNLVEVYLRNTN